jgi:Domain of unknown function (DUF4402)
MACLCLTLCAAGTLMGSATANAKDVARAVGTSEALVVERLSLLKVEDLDFGKIIPGTTAGTVSIAPDGARTASGGALGVAAGYHPASFAGYGFRNQSVLLSVGSNSPTMTRIGGSETMQFTNFTIGSAPPTTLSTVPRSFLINSSTGMFAFTVGATLKIKARQEPGIYQGTFSIIITHL